MSSSSTSPTSRQPQRPSLAPPTHPPARPPSPRSPSYNTPPPLHLTIRFSTSLPDLHLDILTPHQTTVAALKSLIRTRLTLPNSTRRLRFIHSGKILPDAAVLSSVLRAPPPGHDDHTSNAKGKGVEGRAERRVYVNCALGDVLTPEELEEEGKAAAEVAVPTNPPPQTRHASPAPTPRGFERLLNAGFTAGEVNSLRLQFRSIQAARFTPDTMPSPDTLRGMEDAWIDNNNETQGAGGGAGVGVGDGEDPGDDGQGMAGLLDTLVKGMVVGFMFPLGSVGWLIREEGLWSRRWQVFACFGALLSFAIGLIRAMSGE